MLIPMSELNGMKPDISKEMCSIYFLDNGLLLKRFNRLYGMEKFYKFRRYEYARDIKGLEAVSLPIDVLETEKGFCGYVEKAKQGVLDGTFCQAADFINENKYTLTLDWVTQYILGLSEVVDKCHEHGIIIPDLASKGNVYFEPNTMEFWLGDFQDMQVKDVAYTGISDFIAKDPVIVTKKYMDCGLCTENIDLYTITVLYLYYATKVNLPRAIGAGYPLEDIIGMVGLQGSEFADCLRKLYDPNGDNFDIKNVIVDLNDKYVVSDFKPNQPKQFLKK